MVLYYSEKTRLVKGIVFIYRNWKTLGKTIKKPNTACTYVWDSAAFSSIFLASSFSCSQAESTPAPAPQPAGIVRERKPLDQKNPPRLARRGGFLLTSKELTLLPSSTTLEPSQRGDSPCNKNQARRSARRRLSSPRSSCWR